MSFIMSVRISRSFSPVAQSIGQNRQAPLVLLLWIDA